MQDLDLWCEAESLGFRVPGLVQDVPGPIQTHHVLCKVLQKTGRGHFRGLGRSRDEKLGFGFKYFVPTTVFNRA